MLPVMREDPRNKTEPGARGSAAGLWGRVACAWAVAFAGLHLFWALGGAWGLSVSAGPLADERPTWFVVVGLWGVGLLCLAGGVLGWLLAVPRPPGPVGRALRLLGWCVCAVLLVRGVAVEVLLLSGASGPGGGRQLGTTAVDAAVVEPLVPGRRSRLRPGRVGVREGRNRGKPEGPAIAAPDGTPSPRPIPGENASVPWRRDRSR